MSHFKTPAVTPENPESLGKQALTNVASINWNELDSAQVNVLGRAVNLLLDDPTHLWQAIEFYRSLFSSEHDFESAGLMLEGKVATRLRDNWLAMHGADLHKRHEYMEIEGENGYARYKKAWGEVSEAFRANVHADEVELAFAEPHRQAGTYSEFESRLREQYAV
jgi:hypothetical protein